MENNDQVMAPQKPEFDKALGRVTFSLKVLQKDILNLVLVAEKEVSEKSDPVRLFNIVNTGRLCEIFTELTTMVYQYESNYKQALEVKETNES